MSTLRSLKIAFERNGHEFFIWIDQERLTEENPEKIAPRYAFFPNRFYIIRRKVRFTYQCVVFHMTDLHFGREGSSLRNLIVRGKVIRMGKRVLVVAAHPDERKCDAMRCYSPELCDFPHPRSIEGIKALVRLRGSTAGIQYAEAFRLIRKIQR